jgi:hypothetical protein
VALDGSQLHSSALKGEKAATQDQRECWGLNGEALTLNERAFGEIVFGR